MKPRFVIESVDPRDEQDVFVDHLLGRGVALAEGTRYYRLRRNMTARLISSDFDSKITTNDLGLRGKPLRKDADFRLLMLGDSFTMGFGVDDDETFSARLESSLHERGFHGTEVVNAGVFLYNPYSSYYYLIEEGVVLKPDIVVLNLWVGDDIFRMPGVAELSLESEATLKDHLRMFAINSQLISLIVDRLRGVAPVRPLLFRLGVIKRYNVDSIYLADADQRYEREISALKDLLEKFKEFCKSNEMRFFVVLLPAREQVVPGLLKDMMAYNGNTVMTSMDIMAPNRIVRKLTDSLEIEFLDMFNPIKTDCAAGSCYFHIRDIHLNAYGNKVVADNLMSWLEPVVISRDSE